MQRKKRANKKTYKTNLFFWLFYFAYNKTEHYNIVFNSLKKTVRFKNETILLHFREEN